ncbi:helix-turn-helix domain-containing protein [Halobacillus salinarum]|uniref:Helix-turn-helix domain-containing protein n=1 Tax=Halobacillus salinarum TaxID=2932257 RepID=A0ABY4ELW7_9BACI|nr:helix-turn-helix domain-containing protein [Halobacillus salinarum]UOQ45445.1 helix-turn-helix domain-containing protein [Halobacillus salinarum]
MQTHDREEDLEYGCKLVNETTNIPIYVVDIYGKVNVDYTSDLPLNPMFSTRKEQLKTLNISTTNTTFPQLYTSPFQEHFVIISMVNHGACCGSIILGPTVSPKPSTNFIENILTSHEGEEIALEIKDYFTTLPVISSWKLLQASILLFYLIYREKLDMQEIINKNSLSVAKSRDDVVSDRNISELRQNAAFHQDPVAEKKLYQFVQDGNKEDLLLYNKAFHHNKGIVFGKLSRKSELRNQKNLKIATITLATRAAIEGGLHPEIAYTLGDTFIQEMEELRTVNDVEIFIENALCEFADRVQKSNKQQYSKPIGNCMNYIFTHIYESIPLPVLAEYVEMNPKYLSNLFKKEVGVSITEYTQQTKIEEALKLMTFSNYSLAEIYTLLNFSDQSYFIKVFKKYMGMTPKQYMRQQIR